MIYLALLNLLSDLGIPFAYHHWERPPAPPYGVYLDDTCSNFGADNIVYDSCPHIIIEIYTTFRDKDLEKKLEKILEKNEIYWDKICSYVGDLRAYQTIYDFEGIDLAKIKFGLKNVHYARLHYYGRNTIYYDTPVRIPGAVNLTMDAQGDTNTFYADDGLIEITTANGGYQGTLEIAIIPDSFRADILGEKLDQALSEYEGADSKPFALLYEFHGDQKSSLRVLYNCVANRPGLSSTTISATKTPNTDVLSIQVIPLADGRVSAKTTKYSTQTVRDNWYNAVWMPRQFLAGRDSIPIRTKGNIPIIMRGSYVNQ